MGGAARGPKVSNLGEVAKLSLVENDVECGFPCHAPKCSAASMDMHDGVRSWASSVENWFHRGVLFVGPEGDVDLPFSDRRARQVLLTKEGVTVQYIMRRTHLVLVGLLFLALLVQLYLAAVGAFDSSHDDNSFSLHRTNGMTVIPGLTVLATIAAALSRAPIRLTIMTFLPLPLGVLQMGIRAIAEAFNTSGGETSTTSLTIFGLHAINAMIIMLITRGVYARAKKRLAAGPGAQQPAEAAAASA
jgi:hypothetical protein